ncbi:MAG: Hsp20/alpha crystallin family protein [Vicinamibacterales bacterium]
MAQYSFIPAADSSELAEDLRELFEELARSLERGQRAYSGEYRPALDVRETDSAIEVVMDIAGVPAAAVRVVFRAGILLIAGEKAQPSASTGQTFHLVEREFGRFARAVRLTGAFDLQRGRAEVRHGELVIVLPKITDRRGQAHRIPVGGA